MSQDILTNAQSKIRVDKARINAGKSFIASMNTGSIAGDALYKFSLLTPSRSTGKLIVIDRLALSAALNPMRVTLYEDTSATGGTAVSLRNARRSNSAVVANAIVKAGETAALAGKNMMASTAGGNFGNQPNNDGVEVISSDNADKGQIVTLYGTLHGATTVVVTEQLTLNGTTQVVSTKLNWSKILGVELSASCAGTVTVREASGDQTITTILTTVLSAGVATITEDEARDTVLRHDANGASTKSIGIIGTSPSGAVITAVDELNGTTEEDHGALVFRTVTKILIGDVESARECWVLRPEVILNTTYCSTGNTRDANIEGLILDPSTTYVINVTNGSTTASTGYVDLIISEVDMEIRP